MRIKNTPFGEHINALSRAQNGLKFRFIEMFNKNNTYGRILYPPFFSVRNDLLQTENGV